jgi:hypothetical protein
MDLQGEKIAILATNGFEQSELKVPCDRLKGTGAMVEIVSLASGEIKGWDKKDRGRPVKVDKTIEPKTLKFIKDIFDAKKDEESTRPTATSSVRSAVRGVVGLRLSTHALQRCVVSHGAIGVVVDLGRGGIAS